MSENLHRTFPPPFTGEVDREQSERDGGGESPMQIRRCPTRPLRLARLGTSPASGGEKGTR